MQRIALPARRLQGGALLITMIIGIGLGAIPGLDFNAV
jgi:hypothetical protein